MSEESKTQSEEEPKVTTPEEAAVAQEAESCENKTAEGAQNDTADCKDAAAAQPADGKDAAADSDASEGDGGPEVAWKEPSQAQADVVDWEKKASELEDKLLRSRAEFDNYRKRMVREISDARDSTRRATVSDFLTVYDYFAMGMASIDTAPNLEILKQGMSMIWAEFQKTLDSLGVKAVESVGKPFDAKLHDAVSQEASDTVAEGIVLREWKKAFMIGDKLLRPAVVVVSSGPAAVASAEAQAEEKASKEGAEE